MNNEVYIQEKIEALQKLPFGNTHKLDLVELLLLYCYPNLHNSKEITDKILQYCDNSLKKLLQLEMNNILDLDCRFYDMLAVINSLKNFNYVCTTTNNRHILHNTQSIKYYIQNNITFPKHYSQYRMILINNKNELLHNFILNENNAGAIAIREIIKIVLNYDTASVVLMHAPQKEQSIQEVITLTKQIILALNFVNIKLIDHYIASENNIFSLVEHEFINVL